jgi:hypothetical protein
MQPANTSFVAEEERPLVRDALIGILVGMVAFSLVTFFVVLIGWPDQSVGFAAVIAVFCGPWAGLFFGSAGGAAYSQWRAAKPAAESAESAHDHPFSVEPATLSGAWSDRERDG